jgi:hypothetical protein
VEGAIERVQVTAVLSSTLGIAVWAPINYRSGLSISNRYRLIDQ